MIGTPREDRREDQDADRGDQEELSDTMPEVKEDGSYQSEQYNLVGEEDNNFSQPIITLSRRSRRFEEK